MHPVFCLRFPAGCVELELAYRLPDIHYSLVYDSKSREVQRM